MREDKEEGIVLSTIKYGDKGLVVNILTHGEGRRAFMASAQRGKSMHFAMLMPLANVEFVATGVKPNQMQRMTEVHLLQPFRSIPFSPVKRAEAFFIAELLCHAVPNDVPDAELYTFVSHAVAMLDDGMEGDYNFHLLFMMRLAAHLGFAPDTGRSEMPIFDLVAGVWAPTLPPHPDVLTDRMADLWHWLTTVTPDNLSSMPMSRAERQELITHMTRYYQLHQPGFRNLTSQSILAQL